MISWFKEFAIGFWIWLFESTSCSFLAWIKCTVLSLCPSWDCVLVDVNPYMISLIFFTTSDLDIGPSKTCNGSLFAFPLWFSSFPFLSKGFNIESSPTSTRKSSITLKVGDTLYLFGRFNLYCLAFIFSGTWNGLSPQDTIWAFFGLKIAKLSQLVWDITCLLPLAWEAQCYFFFWSFLKNWPYRFNLLLPI